ARLMSQALRKLTSAISRTKTTVVFINQIRMKIGVMFGSPETTTGGNALKFYASVRLDIRRTGAIKKGEDIVGNDTKVKVVKNKMAPPFKLAKFSIMYGEGVSHGGEVIDMGVEYGHVKKSGAWYAVGTERIGQGRDKAITYLKEHPDMMFDVESKVRAELDLPSIEKEKAVKPEKSNKTVAESGAKKA
ncbi:MAG: recombinase RecA, partial [Ghiorsea sp.]